ncbi:hypothetical protein BAE44_0026121, partial [Dichanthelium oligosanthes]
LETSDHLPELGIAICFDSRCNVDSRIDTAISLASATSLINLHPSMSEAVFWLAFLTYHCNHKHISQTTNMQIH